MSAPATLAIILAVVIPLELVRAYRKTRGSSSGGRATTASS